MTDRLVILGTTQGMSSDNHPMRERPLNSAQLLKGVSRSFGLSIRCLPPMLREPVGLAYLLARIADTIADTCTVPVERRQDLLERLKRAIEHPQRIQDLDAALKEFANDVPDRNERELLTRSQDCLLNLQALLAQDRCLIKSVLQAITEGQLWDLHMLDGSAGGVKTTREVDHYTWMVAGSVGEFWTRICDLHLHNWHTATPAGLMVWGAQYGKGLQRLNILRDAGRDLRAGRCYFPSQELLPAGLTPQILCEAVRAGDTPTLQRMAPVLQAWQEIVCSQLHDGLRYSLSLKGLRLRLASALPCLIGIRTLSLLRQAGPQALLMHIKLPRSEVHRLLVKLLLGTVSDRQMQACWSSGLAPTRVGAISVKIGS
jgi:farnesyl-diphosphate farnesyltransferase